MSQLLTLSQEIEIELLVEESISIDPVTADGGSETFQHYINLENKYNRSHKRSGRLISSYS